jgi:hypothetical protein
VELEDGGTRKGAGSCVRPCVLYTDSRTRPYYIHASTRKLEYVLYEYVRVHMCVCVCAKEKVGDTYKGSRGWPESAGVDGFERGSEGMSGGGACI